MSSPETAMTPAEAARVLGVAPGSSEASVREAYRREIRAHHPDRAGVTSSDRASRIIAAYRVLDGAPPSTPPGPAPRTATDDAHGGPSLASAHITRVDVDTITIDAPADEAFRIFVDAASDIGEITYLDRSGALFEVLCRFEGEPATSLMLTVQGRATGTDAFCTVESIEARPAPPAAAVVSCFELALRRRHDAAEP